MQEKTISTPGDFFEPEKIHARTNRPTVFIAQWSHKFQNISLIRIYTNYAHADGNLRAAGMGFQAVFALFAASWLAISVAGASLGTNLELLETLIQLINRSIPGLIATATSEGIIHLSTLSGSWTFGWTSFVASAGLLWTSISWFFYTRQAIRAMFGLSRDTTSYLLQKAFDLLFALVFGLMLISSAILIIISTQMLTFFLTLLQFDTQSWWVTLLTRSLTLIFSALLNMGVLILMFRMLSRLQIPKHQLFWGTLIGALALSTMSLLGGVLLRQSGSNPLFATFSVFIGLLIWFNLVSRIMLLSASWIAVKMSDEGVSALKVDPQEILHKQKQKELHERILLLKAKRDYAQETYKQSSWFTRKRTYQAYQRAQEELDAVSTVSDLENS